MILVHDPSAGTGASESGAQPGTATTSSESVGSDAKEDRPAPASVMKDTYFAPRSTLFRVPQDNVLAQSPMVILRADHGHGIMFQRVIEHV